MIRINNTEVEYLDTYEDGSLCVVVETGMPERNVKIGVGDTWREAVESLESTAIQSVGRDCGLSAALEWAVGAGWISRADLDAVEVDWSEVEAPRHGYAGGHS